MRAHSRSIAIRVHGATTALPTGDIGLHAEPDREELQSQERHEQTDLNPQGCQDGATPNADENAESAGKADRDGKNNLSWRKRAIDNPCNTKKVQPNQNHQEEPDDVNR